MKGVHHAQEWEDEMSSTPLLYRLNTVPFKRQNGLDQVDTVILEFIRKKKNLRIYIGYLGGERGNEGALAHPNTKLTAQECSDSKRVSLLRYLTDASAEHDKPLGNRLR